MSKKNKNNTNSKLIPELRFPEFKDKPQWEVKTIGEVFTTFSGGTPQTKNKDYYGGDIPFIRSAEINSDKTELFITPEGLQNSAAKLVQKGDLLIALYGSNSADSGIAKINGAINQAVLCLRSEHTNEFAHHYITHSKKSITANYLQGGQGNLSGEIIKQLPLPLPSLAEQERIGEFFSVLDSLIQAQSKEVQLLRLRKKGLMQKMFPYEGETTPEWRFPEFKDAPEWEEVSFIDCIKLYRGSSPRPIKNYITKDKDGVNWIKIGDATNCENKIINNVSEKITREGALRSRKVTKGELILANSMSYGKVYELGIDGYIYDGWFVLREYEEHYNRDFLRFMLNSDFIQKQYRQTSAGGVVLNISSDIVYNTQLYLTSKAEQKRIASLFSTLDSLIEAKSQRLEQLKKHKKGLMQKMFP